MPPESESPVRGWPGPRRRTELQDLERPATRQGRCAAFDRDHELQRLILVAVSKFTNEVHPAGNQGRLYPLSVVGSQEGQTFLERRRRHEHLLLRPRAFFAV